MRPVVFKNAVKLNVSKSSLTTQPVEESPRNSTPDSRKATIALWRSVEQWHGMIVPSSASTSSTSTSAPSRAPKHRHHPVKRLITPFVVEGKIQNGSPCSHRFYQSSTDIGSCTVNVWSQKYQRSTNHLVVTSFCGFRQCFLALSIALSITCLELALVSHGQ